jgi:Flp pilus assembly protein TadD
MAWTSELVNGVVLFAVVSIAGCATTQAPHNPPPQIEIQDAVGFTITEEARVSGDVRVDYDQALRFLERGELEKGIHVLEAVVEAAPHLSAPRIDLGLAYHLAGQLEAAERSLVLALEANLNHPNAHNELGIVYRKSGRFAKAKRSYEAALAIYPGYHFARRNLAVLCDLYLADLNCALENYEAYMTTVAGDSEVSMWMEDIRYRMEKAEQ